MPPHGDYLGRWIASKQDRGCLPRTISQYLWVAHRAFNRLRSAGRQTNPRRWSTEDARWLRQAMGQDPWRLSILADLARFSRNSVFQEVGVPRRGPRKRVRWLSEEQVRALLEVTNGDRLLRLIALLGLGQGLRRVEWLRMQVQDVDLAGERLLVRGKGRGQPKISWMPMHPALPQAFRDYLWWRARKVRRFLRQDDTTPVPGELFLHRKAGRLVPYGSGGADGWMTILERRLRDRGVVVKLSSHMLRRSGATLLEKTLLRSPAAARDGVYRSIQEFLRHENLATTMQYLESDPSRQRRAMEVFGGAFDWGRAGAIDPLPGAREPERPSSPPSSIARRRRPRTSASERGPLRPRSRADARPP